jgi:hypothetical protein
VLPVLGPEPTLLESKNKKSVAQTMLTVLTLFSALVLTLITFPGKRDLDASARSPVICVNTRELRENSFLRTERKPNQPSLGLEREVCIGRD